MYAQVMRKLYLQRLNFMDELSMMLLCIGYIVVRMVLVHA